MSCRWALLDEADEMVITMPMLWVAACQCRFVLFRWAWALVGRNDIDIVDGVVTVNVLFWSVCLIVDDGGRHFDMETMEGHSLAMKMSVGDDWFVLRSL